MADVKGDPQGRLSQQDRCPSSKHPAAPAHQGASALNAHARQCRLGMCAQLLMQDRTRTLLALQRLEQRASALAFFVPVRACARGKTMPELTEAQKTLARVIERLRSPGLTRAVQECRQSRAGNR